MKYDKIVIGIDQSYTRTGLTVGVDGKIWKTKSIDFKKCKTKTQKRRMLSDIINKILSANVGKAREVMIICERIRTFSRPNGCQKGQYGKDKKGGSSFLSIDYIKSTGALVASVVDIASDYNVPVYSVDTRSWKSKVVGTSKGGKMPTIKHVKSLGIDVSYRNKKGKLQYNDDVADSACICLYGFLKESDQVLKAET